MDVLCIGCGDNLSWKPNDRRNLESDSSKPVLEISVDRHAVTHATQEVLIDLMHNCVMGVVTRVAWQANTNGGYAVKLLLFV